MNTPIKWNPFRTSNEIEKWELPTEWNPFREMDRWFSNRLSRLMPDKEAMTITEWSPAVDIAEDEKEFTVKAELPEVKKEDVKVTVEDGVLSIRGERKAEKEEKNKKYHRIERSYGSFERSFTLPEGTEPGKISSQYKDGILTVHLPKNPQAKSGAIEVKVQ